MIFGCFLSREKRILFITRQFELSPRRCHFVFWIALTIKPASFINTPFMSFVMRLHKMFQPLQIFWVLPFIHYEILFLNENAILLFKLVNLSIINDFELISDISFELLGHINFRFDWLRYRIETVEIGVWYHIIRTDFSASIQNVQRIHWLG